MATKGHWNKIQMNGNLNVNFKNLLTPAKTLTLIHILQAAFSLLILQAILSRALSARNIFSMKTKLWKLLAKQC